MPISVLDRLKNTIAVFKCYEIWMYMIKIVVPVTLSLVMNTSFPFQILSHSFLASL